MLAWINRNRFFCHVIALFKDFLVNHRETVADKIRILIGNIQEEVIRTRAIFFFNDGMRNISRSKFQPFIIAIHKPFLVAIQQVSTFSTNCFGNQEAFPCVVVIESSRVELNEVEIQNLCTEVMSKGNAVTGCNFGIGGVGIHSANTASCQQNKVAVVDCECIVFPDVDREAGAGFL